MATALESTYDDGGFPGGNAERLALRRWLAEFVAKRVRTVANAFHGVRTFTFEMRETEAAP